MSNRPKLAAKKEFPSALEKACGIISTACKFVGISRETYRQWCIEDKEFKRLCAEAKENGEELGLDAAESALFKNIKDGKESSIFYYLNNKGKSRGYSKITADDSNKLNLTLDLSTLTNEQLDRQINRLTNSSAS